MYLSSEFIKFPLESCPLSFQSDHLFLQTGTLTYICTHNIYTSSIAAILYALATENSAHKAVYAHELIDWSKDGLYTQIVTEIGVHMYLPVAPLAE